MAMETENYTPNVIIENPDHRKIVNNILSWLGIVLGSAIALDGASADIDLLRYTVPALAVHVFLAGTFGLSVIRPNIPKA